MIIFQEQIERESISIALKAARLTADAVIKAFEVACNQIYKTYVKSQTPKGCQSVKKLMNHNCPTNTVPIEGDKGLFEKIARKWNVDYAFHQTGKGKYLLLFKSGQADAITACMSEYSKCVIKRAKDKRPPVMDELKKAKEQADRAAEREKPKHKELTRAKEAVRE